MNIIYIRTSTEEQNPENQLRDIFSMGVSQDTVVYEDKQSAWKDHKERLNFEKVKKQIQTQKITDLYVWDWDRIYRNRLRLKEFFAFCKIYKVNIHSYRQDWYEAINNIPSPFNEIVLDLMINLMGWMAEDESKKKSERVRAATRTKDGRTISYKGNKWGRKALPKQTKDRIIECFNQGMSIRKIASTVQTTDKNKNMKPVSVGAVHKTIAEYRDKNSSLDVSSKISQ